MVLSYRNLKIKEIEEIFKLKFEFIINCIKKKKKQFHIWTLIIEIFLLEKLAHEYKTQLVILMLMSVNASVFPRYVRFGLPEHAHTDNIGF